MTDEDDSKNIPVMFQQKECFSRLGIYSQGQVLRHCETLERESYTFDMSFSYEYRQQASAVGAAPVILSPIEITGISIHHSCGQNPKRVLIFRVTNASGLPRTAGFPWMQDLQG